jgi:hypothetical protein
MKSIDFELGAPFTPLTQLMGVLPPASHRLVPEAYRPLMLDGGSPILDFYPPKFEGGCTCVCVCESRMHVCACVLFFSIHPFV